MPSPTLSARALSTTSRVNSAATDLTTMARDVAVHRCPVEPNAPCTVPVAASSRSASSSTMTGFLPPISHCTFLSVRAASEYNRVPTSFEPVNEMARMSGCSTSTWPTDEPGP
jgi:hypothetical protein